MRERITKRRNTEVRQRQIINAARAMIVKRGSEHITIRCLAKAVDISEAAIYRHFKNKKAILSLLVDDIEKGWLADLSSVNTNGKSLLAALEEGLKGPLSVKRRGVSFQVIAEIVSLGDKRLNQKISVMIDKYIEHLTELLSQGIKSGEVRKDVDKKAAATILFGMMQGLVSIWALSGYNFDPEERYATLWSVFRKAVSAR